VIERFRRAFALAPKPFERTWVWPVRTASFHPAGIFHFKKIATYRAAKIWLSLRAGDFGAATKAA
jgi:hypothetical protein